MPRTILGILFGLVIAGCGHIARGVDIWKAVERNDIPAIRKYGAAGGDVNILGWDGSTPLWTALEGEKRYSYEALLDCGADPNIILRGKRVVTHWAAMEEDPWWLRLALEHGADPNLVNVGHGSPLEGPPLRAAIGLRGTLENVKLLVEHGADINKPYPDGCYPLSSALVQNKWEVVLYLLDRGADYTLAECGSIKFLEEFRGLYQRKEVFLIKGDREKLDEIRAWLESRGIDVREK